MTVQQLDTVGIEESGIIPIGLGANPDGGGENWIREFKQHGQCFWIYGKGEEAEKDGVLYKVSPNILLQHVKVLLMKK